MIIKFYVMRITNGDTTFDKVPVQLREQVRQQLIEQGYEHLTGGV